MIELYLSPEEIEKMKDEKITKVITSPTEVVNKDTPVIEIIRRGKSASSLLKNDNFCDLMDKTFEECSSFVEWFVPANTDDILDDIREMNVIGIVFIEEDGNVSIYKAM